MSEPNPFYAWWDRQPSFGARRPRPEDIWGSALEWAAEQVEEIGCNCNVRIHPNTNKPGKHYRDCPRSLAAKLRKGCL